MSPTLNGEDLKTMGLKTGQKYKRILEALMDERLNGEITTDAEERQLAERLAKEGRLS